ncbi:MAG TPA: acyl-CoA dehydratase activase [Candidatus Avalokitesvara rifleensis]|uniref:acyl-CoA dehydratase activase n=1 Tax=Candidatus Avalokitesvara rifleensis TaxID=3367620 RepID=UPI002712DD6E|nr:acyl-CoA dehydratase activase [Candidatus Brocadiales bacterium]
MAEKKYIGLDIGSVSLKVVLINDKKEVLEEHYVRAQGQPLEATLEVLNGVYSRTPREQIKGMACTGSGGKLLSEIFGIYFVNEVVAQSKGTATYYPEVRSIIEIGGQDSKLMLLEYDKSIGQIRVADFAMNTMCAAGTGSFLDQQASRVGISIEGEFAELALKSKNPPRIAGRCSVFAKSDMIHLQQEATPVHDILAGLCYAMARNFKSAIAKGKEMAKPIAFQGGVAANNGMIKAFEDVLDLKPGDLIIPKHHASLGAIGAALMIMEKGAEHGCNGLGALESYLRNRKSNAAMLEALKGDNYDIVTHCVPANGNGKVEAYVGVDVGSISTNVIVIDKDKNVLARRYLMTAGRPLEAVTKGLFEVGMEVGDKVDVKGVCTTGSGRYLTGDYIGADVTKNEITAHARAAANACPDVDTIFEIGGQDSKYIRMENGAVVDFAMNKVCAAGTGAFLEEQSERLGIAIKEEFGRKALSSCGGCGMGERCTVFMESDIVHHQQKGATKQDLVAGLSYSIVLNYLNRVVESRRVGDRILFQGGVAYNRGVKAAFEKVTGKEIIVPPHHDCMGAIGSAIIAMEERNWEKSKFKGFDLRKRKCEVGSFVCRDCSNICTVKKVEISGEEPLHYGDRCGKYEDSGKPKKGRGIPRLFKEREKALFNSYPKDKPDAPNGMKMGMPRANMFFELYPMWKAFFTELGFEVVPSSPTNPELIKEGVENIAAETCFPIKVAHGHVMDMLDKDIDYLFIPSVVNFPNASPKLVHSYMCPYVQGLPYMVRAVAKFAENGKKFKVLEPAFHLEWGMEHLKNIFREIARDIGQTGERVEKAVATALSAQQDFYDTLAKRGKEALASLKEDEIALVIVGRTYNSCDEVVSLRIPDKLRELGVLAIPMDMLPLDVVEIAEEYPHMYWRSGQKIIAAARFIGKDKRLYPLYITNFGCGPDAFILKHFEKELSHKPQLTIEIDEHSADAGIITRCEAYLDSLKNVRNGAGYSHKPPVTTSLTANAKTKRKVFIPYMDDHVFPMAAAMSACGVDAEPLPMPDKQSLDIGRRFTSGKECYPAILTTGDIVKKATDDDFDRSHSAFFMATAYGPCRFGQYNKFHRMVLDDLGFKDVPVITLDQDKDYQSNMASLGTDFKKLAWKGILLVDYLQRLLRETRPYELNKGQSDAVYKHYLEMGTEWTRNRKDLLRVAQKARDAFHNIPVDRGVRKPLIGIIGEVYVRSCAYSNSFVVDRIEKLGGEAILPPFEEWINYIGYCRREDCLREQRWGAYLKELITDLIQRWQAFKRARPFKGHIRHFYRESPSWDVIQKGKKYLHPSFRGEAILSMGRAVEYAEHGVHGIMNMVPFHCMPGTVVNALLERLQKDHDGIPIIKMAFDGQEETNEQTRLEAFMHQAHQRMESKSGTNGGH